nr:hypothetical protein CFP56_76571 [Quercus suber]
MIRRLTAEIRQAACGARESRRLERIRKPLRDARAAMYLALADKQTRVYHHPSPSTSLLQHTKRHIRLRSVFVEARELTSSFHRTRQARELSTGLAQSLVISDPTDDTSGFVRHDRLAARGPCLRGGKALPSKPIMSQHRSVFHGFTCLQTFPARFLIWFNLPASSFCWWCGMTQLTPLHHWLPGLYRLHFGFSFRSRCWVAVGFGGKIDIKLGEWRKQNKKPRILRTNCTEV